MLKKISVIDCQLAGVSGDMLIAALLDLGANEEKTIEAMKNVKNFVNECEKLKISVIEKSIHGIKAKKLVMDFIDKKRFRFGREILEVIEKCVSELSFSNEAKIFALNSAKTLIEAEAKIHGEKLEEVKLHETGSIDTLVDIIGVAKAAEELNLFKETVYSTPVAVGKGLLKFSHGIFSIPAPATLEILKKRRFKFLGGEIDGELTTPTGAALLTNLASTSLSSLPLMIPLSVGYGSGSKNFKEGANILRVIKGEIEDPSYPYMDLIYVLETNLDDVSGEVIGYVMERLINEGAKDASIIPIFTKKNRPGYILKVISDETHVNKLISLIMKETGTLGVRVSSCIRHLALRDKTIVKINLNQNIKEQIALKISRSKEGELIQVKPEYEEARKIALKTNQPLKEVYFKAVKEAEKILSKIGRRKTGSQHSW
ncbi:MAG: nickel pincer cofactor biosynthesis protein LarC [Candidatus Bathyarchaeia archaeon]